MQRMDKGVKLACMMPKELPFQFVASEAQEVFTPALVPGILLDDIYIMRGHCKHIFQSALMSPA